MTSPRPYSSSELRTAARGARPERAGPGGPLLALLVAFAVVGLALAGVRWGIGITGLGSVGMVNDAVVEATAPGLLAAVVVATALAVRVATASGGRGSPVLSHEGQIALTVTLLSCMIVLPMMILNPLFGTPHSASLVVAALVAELTVGAGACLGVLALRHRWMNVLVLAGALMLGLDLIGQSIVDRVLAPDPADLIWPSEIEGALMTLRELDQWRPRASAMAVAASVVAIGTFRSDRMTRGRHLVAMAAAPPLLPLASTLLALPFAGNDVLETRGRGLWLWLMAGSVAGLACLLVPRFPWRSAPRRRRP
ncbi:hypothetical protein [Actinomadura rugatobispora]|uniref:DUF1275 domain-containing protein n=1 Tax=Actinomadura rugatobispora TaxID=1994 RepID=A0ABW0ZT21_9ACTN|nr:hypothetical protein GCM10010200_096620 [Actinomadura rugatobispora]